MERKLPPVQEFGFTGMTANRDARLPLNEFQLLRNVFIEDGVLRTRPGTDRLGNASLHAGSKIQGIYLLEELNGTLHTLAFCNATMYEFDWAAGRWDATNLPPAIVMDPSSELSFANSRGRLIVTNRVNRPWMMERNEANTGWDFTLLNDAPIAGGVTIYYDQVFFFDCPDNESAFFWSEPGDPTIGYEAGTYRNVWDFAQTDQGRITGLVGLNRLMVVFKEDAIAQLRGQFAEDFQTDAVREGISETQGSLAHSSVTVLDGDIFFLAQGGPRGIAGGARLLDITRRQGSRIDRVRDLWAEVNREEWRKIQATISSVNRRVWWAYAKGNSDERRDVFIYDVIQDAWWTYSFPFAISSMAEIEVATGDTLGGNEWVLLGDEEGNVYRYGLATRYVDGVNDAAIERVVRSRFYGNSTPAVTKRLVDVRWQVEAEADPLHEFSPAFSSAFAGHVGAAAGTLETFESVPDARSNQRDLKVSTIRGRHFLRRGYNLMNGYGSGWEIRFAGRDRFSLYSATTQFTAVDAQTF